MTNNIRRLFCHYMIAMKREYRADHFDDEDIREWARYLSVDALKDHYLGGSIDVEDFELLVGLALGAGQPI